MIIIYTIAEFVCGSLMFSYWLGCLARKNIRTVGDGNPGAANLWKAAGYKLGLLGVFLDFSKGYFPLVLLVNGGYVTGYSLIPVALAPILGHAFSPFLSFRGGKAIAVTFGVWSAITGFEVSVAYAVILAIFLILLKLYLRGKKVTTEADSFQTVAGFLLVWIYLFVRDFSMEYIWVWLGNAIILIFTNRYHLMNLIKTRSLKKEEEEDVTI